MKKSPLGKASTCASKGGSEPSEPKKSELDKLIKYGTPYIRFKAL